MFTTDLKVGDTVLVIPHPQDAWHEFQGTIKGFRDGELITVEDQDGDCFDCDVDQIKRLQE